MVSLPGGEKQPTKSTETSIEGGGGGGGGQSQSPPPPPPPPPARVHSLPSTVSSTRGSYGVPAPSLALWSLVPSLQATTAEVQRTLSAAARVSIFVSRPGATYGPAQGASLGSLKQVTGDSLFLSVRRFLFLVCRHVNSTFDTKHGCKGGFIHNAKSRFMGVDSTFVEISRLRGLSVVVA